MSTLAAAALILKKELLIEFRTREVVATTGLFALLVVVMASLAFYIDDVAGRRMAPGVLWISVAFAGVLALGRAWAREREHGVFRGVLLSPIPRPAVYLGKGAAVWLFLTIIEAGLLPLVAVLFQVDLRGVLVEVAGLLLLGTLGFVAAGNLFAVMGVRTRARDLMLSVVLFPLVTPALLSGVVATRELLAGASFSEVLGFFQLLVAFDIVFLAAGVVLFEPLTTD